MKNYTKKKNLKMAMMLAIREKLEWNDAVEKNFSELFDSIDKDQNGKLTFDEVRDKVLTNVLRRMGENPTDTEIKLYMDGIDKDGDGAVNKDEFRTWIKELIAILQDPQKSLALAVEVMFKACDVDKNGKISKREFGTSTSIVDWPGGKTTTITIETIKL